MIAEILHPIAGMGREEEQAYRPRPSSAGPERCIRAMVYHRTNTPLDKPIGDRFIHVLNDSWWHAQLTAEWISKSAYAIHSQEMRVTCWEQDGIKIEGDIDGILTDLLGVDRLLELKAINHFTFEGYWNQDEFPEDYFAQTATYMRGVHRLNPDINEALLLIKSKNTSGFIEYLLRYDFDKDLLTIVKLTRHTGDVIDLNLERPDICGKAVQKFKDVEAHATAGTLPERPYPQDHWRCRYCSFNDTCWKGYVEEIASLAESTDLEPEHADRMRYYQELGAHIRDQEEERKGIGQELITILKTKGAKKGKAGEYTVTLVVQDRQNVDWPSVPLHVKAALDQYKKQSISEFVKVSKAKPKG
jgi:hypothetical protein